MHVGVKSFPWRALGVVALLAAANPAFADYIYGSSNTSEANKLIINGVTELKSGKNQGWWSDIVPNGATNFNYFVGSLAGESKVRNNFFVFDISDLSAPVTSAVLQLQVWDVFSSAGAATVLYSLFDVTTSAAILNNNEGTNEEIFNDLGSGKHYGSFAIPTGLATTDVVTMALNSAALADLNAAILSNAENFAIGGTLSFTPAPTQVSVPDHANTMLLLGLSIVYLWSLGRRKPAS